jgi:hypothetical protein
MARQYLKRPWSASTMKDIVCQYHKRPENFIACWFKKAEILKQNSCIFIENRIIYTTSSLFQRRFYEFLLALK